MESKQGKPLSGYTPGPWRVTRRYDLNNDLSIQSTVYGIAAGKRDGPFENRGRFHPDAAQYYLDEIAVVAIAFDDEFGYHDGAIAVEANAALIAQAPTLLEQRDKLAGALRDITTALKGGSFIAVLTSLASGQIEGANKGRQLVEQAERVLREVDA